MNGKSIIGFEMDFSLEEFTDAYKVHKREKPVVVGEECHMHHDACRIFSQNP